MIFWRTPCPQDEEQDREWFTACLLNTQVSFSPSWLRLVFQETNRLIFPAASVGGYWYGPGEAACQLQLNNVTPLSHFHNTHKQALARKHTHRYPLQIQIAETLYIVMLWWCVNCDVCVCACRLSWHTWKLYTISCVKQREINTASLFGSCLRRWVIKCCKYVTCGRQILDYTERQAHTRPHISFNTLLFGCILMSRCFQLVLQLSCVICFLCNQLWNRFNFSSCQPVMGITALLLS